jgi:hypothetical protein
MVQRSRIGIDLAILHRRQKAIGLHPDGCTNSTSRVISRIE